MKKIKYNGPMPYVSVWKIGHFDRGIPLEVSDENAVMLLREPGFVEVKAPVSVPEKKEKGGKE